MFEWAVSTKWGILKYFFLTPMCQRIKKIVEPPGEKIEMVDVVEIIDSFSMWIVALGP